MTRKLSVLSTLISFLLLGEWVAFASLTPVQITTDPANQGRPDVQGNIIVWKDYRNGNWDIYMYDLASADEQAEQPVSVHPAYQNVPVTNGSVIVWQDQRNGRWDIYMKNIGGGEERLAWGPGNHGLPAISGNTVVYVKEDANGQGTELDPSNDIWAVDLMENDGDGLLEGGQPYPVCTDAGSQWHPRISGTMVVWQDSRNGHWNIWAKDLATLDDPFPITGDTDSDNKMADIDGNLVVWQKATSDGVSDIWMKDLSPGGAASAVTNDAAYQNSPAVSGDLIVWENYDYQRASWDVLMRDLTSGVVSPLAETPFTEARPAIDRETVVWESDSPAGYDVWMARVPDTTPPAIEALTPAQGNSSGCDSPDISAGYTDNRAGIDTGSVRLELDGRDVTEGSSVTPGGVSYRSQASLEERTHLATITVADLSGNVSSSSWQFTTHRPRLRLSAEGSYWATYADYSSRQLSVDFSLTNVSPDVQVFEAESLAATATQGVIPITSLPLYLGDINRLSSAEMVMKFKIPEGVTSFRTAITAGLLDECGEYHFIPGPPPDW